MGAWVPCLVKRRLGEAGVEVRLGHEQVDAYLRFVAARCRPNSVLAAGYDLLVFFTVVGKQPAEVDTMDVLEFITSQRAPRRRDTGPAEQDEGLSPRTVRRRLATLSGLYGYLLACGLVTTNPVPRGLTTKTAAGHGRSLGVPLIRTTRTLPRVLGPVETSALLTTLRTARDRAMVQAMLVGGLRRCEVLGLRLKDIQLGDRRLLVAEGKGGHQRIVPVSSSFFTTLGQYLDAERGSPETDAVFVVLKGPNRGRPLSAAGVGEGRMLSGR